MELSIKMPVDTQRWVMRGQTVSRVDAGGVVDARGAGV